MCADEIMLLTVSIGIVLYVFLKLFLKFQVKRCELETTLEGKTCVITGANTGFGYQVALAYARRRARVILACRNESRANNARAKIIAETANENVIVKIVDLSSLKSVRDFARDLNSSEAKVDILVNNAGIENADDVLTEDGLQLGMQVNYFGPFLLTILLLDLLRKSAKSRIINVSSCIARIAITFDVNNLNKYRWPFGGHIMYCESKLCNIFFTQELSKRLRHTNITVYSLHPGSSMTGLFEKNTAAFKLFLWMMAGIVLVTTEEAAETFLYLALSKDVEKFNGEHFANCQRVKPYMLARNPEVAEELWNKTVDLLKLSPEDIRFD